MNRAAAGGEARSVYFGEEHEMLRAQLRRFVDEEIKPHGAHGSSDGFVPREVLRRMGALGFFGIRYPAQLWRRRRWTRWPRVVLAEELGRSTFSGVAITALVHTDMASVHLFNAGTRGAEIRAGCRDIVAGETITAVARDRARTPAPT